jgi:hypothetical protein
MAAPALARPGTQESIVTLPGDISLHVNRMQWSSPQFQHGGLLYCQVRLSGFMKSGDELGLATLAGNNNNTGQDFFVRPHNGRSFGGKIVIASIQWEAQKNAPHVMVSLSGVVTDTAPASIEVV